MAAVEHRAHVLGIADRRRLGIREIGEQQLAQIGARHDHALVHVKRDAPDIGPLHEIGGGLARRDARMDQARKVQPLLGQEAGVEEGLEPVDRQAESFKHDEGRLVERIVGAVSVDEIGRVEAADRVAQAIAHGQQFRRHPVHVVGHVRLPSGRPALAAPGPGTQEGRESARSRPALNSTLPKTRYTSTILSLVSSIIRNSRSKGEDCHFTET
jgi:hypothetical protein